MPEKRKFYLTREGLTKIKEEYEKILETRKLKSKKGVPPVLHSEDLNTEFVAFREDLDLLESKIEELKYILKNFELIKPPPKKERDKVHLGAQVQVAIDGEIDEFKIVGTLETNPSNNKISNESPIGQALLGKRVGETVVIKVPIVNHSCKIIKIKYNKL